MDVKLTLSLDKQVVEQAKKYAKRENKSLSRLVQDYFSRLSGETTREVKITPLVKRLSGVIHVEDDFDYKKILIEQIMKKHYR